MVLVNVDWHPLGLPESEYYWNITSLISGYSYLFLPFCFVNICTTRSLKNPHPLEFASTFYINPPFLVEKCELPPFYNFSRFQSPTL